MAEFSRRGWGDYVEMVACCRFFGWPPDVFWGLALDDYMACMAAVEAETRRG